jgi:hypothetical protein
MKKAAGTEFDFLFGNWLVRHRRLTARLAGSDVWQNFDGQSNTQPILGGMGNIEDNLIDLPDGSYRAAALRTYDAATGKWAIWWNDRRTPHILDLPVIGQFVDDIGTFMATDTFNGKPIVVRFVWSDVSGQSPRWEQAYSPDNGQSWEVNWVMDFRRALT